MMHQSRHFIGKIFSIKFYVIVKEYFRWNIIHNFFTKKIYFIAIYNLFQRSK